MMAYMEYQEQKTKYGVLLEIIEHTLYKDGPTMVFMEVEWLSQVGALWDGRMPVVRRNANNRWNTTRYKWDLLTR
jgi:hypothetical protein